jgi:cytochrome c-type biogenesis protein CcmH
MNRHGSSRRLLGMLLAVLALLLVGTVSAQEEITDDEVNEIAAEVYCPVCENTPLDVCPTAACADWRELIRTQLSEGSSRQDVLNYFARQYGDGVLANPPRRGISLIILWIIPILGIALAAVLLARYMRTMRSSATAITPAGPSINPPVPASPAARPTKPRPTADSAGTDLDPYISRLEQELDD